MRSANFERFSYGTKSVLSNIWHKYKKMFILFSIIALIGFVTGIMTVAKVGGNLELSHLPNKAIRNVFSNPKNNWGYFLQQLLSLGIIIFVLLFCNFRPFMIVVDIVLVVYHFYCFGFCFLGIILLYKITGLLNLLFFIFPFFLIINILILFLLCISYKKCLCVKKFGANCIPCNIRRQNKIIVLFILSVIILLLLIQTLMIPFISITIIVV